LPSGAPLYPRISQLKIVSDELDKSAIGCSEAESCF
jgi:hypothetical protein